jgi:peptidoglycan/LPS O-acetylase OafA/YrhL
MLSHQWLLFFGLISYPLYLIHEQAVVGLSVQFSRGLEAGWLAGLIPLLAIAIVEAVAWCIAKKTEPAKARRRNEGLNLQWDPAMARSRPA